ncbi:MAG: DUF2284 domain-containing protein [Clostridiales bacterium]|nr:DUF2284 domain-containing protein [Clostridiales bacterium]
MAVAGRGLDDRDVAHSGERHLQPTGKAISVKIEEAGNTGAGDIRSRLNITAIVFRIGGPELEKLVLESFQTCIIGRGIEKLALELGVTTATVIETAGIEFHEEFREACEQNICRRYNTTWSGPPAVGPVSDLKKRVERFSRGLLIQNITEIEDSFDYEGMLEGGRIHEERFRNLLKNIRHKHPTLEILPLNAGCCNLCERCTYLDGEPCRNPEEAVSSVECYGMDVTALKRAAGLPVSGGKNTVTYVALILFE